MKDAACAVTFWGTYDGDKPRVRLLRDGLVDNGHVVEEINFNAWEGVRDKSRLTGLRARLRIAWRLVCAYPTLFARLIRSPSRGVIVVPYLGQLDVLLVWPLARILKRKLILDVFISLYDTLVFDRGLLAPEGLLSKLIKGFEKCAIGCADLSIMDTASHARRVEQLFGFGEGRLGHVFVGVEEGLFTPADPASRPVEAGPLRVLFYGQMSPLHGIDTILNATQMTKPGAIELTIIGTGQEDDQVETTLKSMSNPVKWVKWAPYAELRAHILRADVCLGIFGESEKAASVIPNKVFQVVAAGRHVVTRDGPGIRELFAPDDTGVTLTPPADPVALAEALAHLADQKAELRGKVFHAEVLQRIARRAIGRDFARLIKDLTEERA